MNGGVYVQGLAAKGSAAQTQGAERARRASPHTSIAPCDHGFLC